MNDDDINIAQRHRFGVPIVPLTEMKATWGGLPWLAYLALWAAGLAAIAWAWWGK